MLDDSLTAEMVGVLLEGVKDGGQPKIDLLYKKYDSKFDSTSITNLDQVLKFISEELAPYLKGTPLLNPPHLLMLFAAVAHVLVGIPQGELAALPPRVPIGQLDHVRDNLLNLASIIASSDEAVPPYTDFWKASKSSTQRIASRKVRFPVFVTSLA